MADIAAIERTPLPETLKVWTATEMIAESARDFADKPAYHFLRDGTTSEMPFTVTYAELGERMVRTANALHHAGLGRGEVVAYLLPNWPETIDLLLGGSAVGTVAPLNWMLEPEHIVHILSATRAKLLVVDEVPEIAAKVEAVLPRLAERPRVVTVSEFVALRTRERGASLECAPPGPDDTALYLHTGGTTGRPKLARLPHRGIVYHCWANAVAKALTHQDVLFAGGPLYHSGGIILDVFSTYGIGATSVILTPMGYRNRTVMANYWGIAARYGLTMLNGVPTVLAGLVNAASPLRPSRTTRRLRPYMGTGSAPLPVEVAKGVERTFGIRPLSTYGATEFTCLISMPPRDGEPKYGSCGLPYAHSRFRAVVLDTDGRVARACAVDEIGAIVVNGPGVIPGYVDAADNEKLFVDTDWLVTGDLGRIDADGYLWITGRLKDVIIRGGHNIDARVIEETLVAHPAVALVAAVGKPDAHAGELPVAYVQLKPGASASPDEIGEFARAHIPERAAAPVEIVVLDALPLTSIGKIYKPPLKMDAARRAFEVALAPFGARVTVEEDARAGTRARISLPDPAKTDEVQAVMGRYAVAWEIEKS